MLHTTRIAKDYTKQWKASTYIQLALPERKLKVSTFKSSRGVLYTSCQGMKVENNSESYILFGDYYKQIMSHADKRVNEKVIGIAHDKALLEIETFVKEANQFYEKNELQG